MPGPAAAIIGGALQIGAGIFGARAAKREASRMKREAGKLQKKLDRLEANRQEIINPYENITDLSSMLSNPFASLSVATQEHATDAIAVLDSAIAKIDQQRSDLGAISNRLSSVVDNNTSMVTNTESSKSHILDTDFAVETTKLTRTQILQQAATSMLAQANASKQSVLALLQNLG